MEAALFGGLPLAGFVAELATGMLSQMLPLFPHAAWAVAAGAAVTINLLLWYGAFDRASPWLQLWMYGFVLGMAGFYAVVVLPAIPLMLLLAVVGLGLLAAAPFFAVVGVALRLLDARKAALASLGRGPCMTVLVVCAAVPFAAAVFDRWHMEGVAARLLQLADSVRVSPGSVATEQLAERVRGDRLGMQRQVCIDRGSEEPFWAGSVAGVGCGRTFWFLPSIHRSKPKREHLEAARLAFVRAHGMTFDEPPDRRPASQLEWRRSRMQVDVDRLTATARVQWELRVGSEALPRDEAIFDVALPSGSVADSLSLWIHGEERPAAFGVQAQVTSAYQQIVSQARDPALLVPTAPGRLQLRLFPLSRSLPAMRCRIGVTVPLRRFVGRTELALPRIVAHPCRAVPKHELTLRIDGAADVPSQRFDEQLSDEQLAEPRLLDAVGANVSWCADAAREVVCVQRWMPGAAQADQGARALVVVVELSRSTAGSAALAGLAMALDRLSAGSRCTVFGVLGAGYRRVGGRSGESAMLAALRELPAASGGVDPRLALAAALQEAKQVGVARVLWLHGAMAQTLDDRDGLPATDVRLEALRVAGGAHVRLASDPEFARRVHRCWQDGWVREPSRLAAAIADWASSAFAFERRLELVEEAPSSAVAAMAAGPKGARNVLRLASAAQADRLAAQGKPSAAASLAIDARVVAGGVGAVVLETPEQYQEAGLQPGLLPGREPAAAGGNPVPEPSSLLLVGVGLCFFALWRRRRARL